LRSTVRVELGARSYEIHIGPGLLPCAEELLGAVLRPSRVFVLTHPAIARLHGRALMGALGAAEVLLIPAGERQKSLHRAARLYDELLTRGGDRKSVILAFGGGVIGDLGGFVASTYMRGLPFVQVPTTLLAQVDASVGGKVAVDHPQAKNLIGAFYQPRLVIADSGVLQTLPARDYRAGLAEVAKHGAIADATLFAWMEASVGAIAARDPEAIGHMVSRSCEIKAEVVHQDEREAGLRAILNFGHTIGHALESITGYRVLRHGEAVAIGMVAVARLSAALGLCEREVSERTEALLTALRLPTRIPGIPVAEILRAMQTDKKAVSRTPRFVLARRIGCVEVGGGVPSEPLTEALVSIGALA
jgi:3-dehydroquinate synthase